MKEKKNQSSKNKITIKTNLTSNQIQENFAPPENDICMESSKIY